jgi:hypothetical protein
MEPSTFYSRSMPREGQIACMGNTTAVIHPNRGSIVQANKARRAVKCDHCCASREHDRLVRFLRPSSFALDSMCCLWPFELETLIKVLLGKRSAIHSDCKIGQKNVWMVSCAGLPIRILREILLVQGFQRLASRKPIIIQSLCS